MARRTISKHREQRHNGFDPKCKIGYGGVGSVYLAIVKATVKKELDCDDRASESVGRTRG
ncbi:hypothetical protein HN51_026014, partial [Arachis hypogaea]